MVDTETVTVGKDSNNNNSIICTLRDADNNVVDTTVFSANDTDNNYDTTVLNSTSDTNKVTVTRSGSTVHFKAVFGTIKMGSNCDKFKKTFGSEGYVAQDWTIPGKYRPKEKQFFYERIWGYWDSDTYKQNPISLSMIVDTDGTVRAKLWSPTYCPDQANTWKFNFDLFWLVD